MPNSEAERTLPMTSVNVLYDAGLLSMCVPRVLGGLEADPLTQTEVYEVVSAMDGSAGWCLVIGATAVGMAGGMISDGARSKRYSRTGASRAGRDGGPRRPGRAGRWRLPRDGPLGLWQRHSSCGMGVLVALIAKNGEPHRFANGRPEICSICVPIQDVVIEDNWYASGLKGTGSSHYRLDDVIVPDDFTLGGKPRRAAARCTDCRSLAMWPRVTRDSRSA